jgi:hypothetical protein
LFEIYQINATSDSNGCVCATDVNCQTNSTISEIVITTANYDGSADDYVVPGWLLGCSGVQSFLLSTLECFYSNSQCFQVLMKYIRLTYIYNVVEPSWVDFQPLIYNQSSSQYFPNTSLSNIVKQLMIEQWNYSYSYDRYYKTCAPRYCAYSQRIHTKTIFGVITTFISIMGGLIFSLRLITRIIVSICMRLVMRAKKKQQQQGNYFSKSYALLKCELER